MKLKIETYLDRTTRQCHVPVTLIIDIAWTVLQDGRHVVKRVVEKLWADGTNTHAHRM